MQSDRIHPVRCRSFLQADFTPPENLIYPSETEKPSLVLTGKQSADRRHSHLSLKKKKTNPKKILTENQIGVTPGSASTRLRGDRPHHQRGTCTG